MLKEWREEVGASRSAVPERRVSMGRPVITRRNGVVIGEGSGEEPGTRYIRDFPGLADLRLS
jgi:hypothetical protein